MDTFVARQPIFTKKEDVHAYELLFRSSLENSFGDVDGDHASVKVLVDGVLVPKEVDESGLNHV